jgi:hypothetical protein
MQRDATAGEEDATAAPKLPVRGQRAMIEKVMTIDRLVA